MPTSVRLDPKTERVVRSLARRTGRTRSQVIRDAIHRLAAVESEMRQGQMVFEMWQDAIGCAEGGPPDLSERTGDHFRSLLLAKRRA
jgi:Arc/MetJ-type ribon-helix-helix transcriptional regulator